jgi:hypothetical protein
MPLPELNNGPLVRSYLSRFERRFVAIDGGVLYVPEEGGGGVKLTERQAASVMAGMREVMVAVDGSNPFSGLRALPVAITLVLVTIMAGALFDFLETAGALWVPILLLVLLAGPLVSVARVHMAWREGLRRVDRVLARLDRVPAHVVARHVPVNPVRALFVGTAIFCGAIFVGLIIASATLPLYARLQLDRWIALIVGPIVLGLGLLWFVTYGVDLIRRRRVPEAEIEDALQTRRSERGPF